MNVGFEIAPLLPFIALCAAACAVLTAGLFTRPPRDEQIGLCLALAGLAASGLAAGRVAGERAAGAIVFDPFAAFVHGLVLLSAGVTLVMASPFLRRTRDYHAEFPALVLFAAAGMSLFAATTNLLMLFLALELLSLPIYVLAGYQRALPRSNEAALKYFVLGAFSSALFLYGIALVYGATGHVDLAALETLPATAHLLPAGLVLVLSGFLFKIGAVPFHMWTPDVYEGAPTPVTAFMATAVKAAAFGALVRFVWLAQGAAGLPDLTGPIAFLAILTMTVGNLGALTQPNVKRMLAFSSIAHAGYLLVGVAALAAAGRAGERGSAAPILYYLLAYAVTNLAAFGVVIAIGRDDARPGRERVRIPELAGLGRRHPGTALVMALAMLSLAGMPPTAGFFGKYFLFREAVGLGLTPLVVWGVLNSALSLYYYLGVIVVMYMKPEQEPIAVELQGALRVALVVLALAIVWGGAAPSGVLPGVPDLLRWAETAVATVR